MPPKAALLEQPCSVHCRLPAPIAPPCSAARVGWGFECLWFKMPARRLEVTQCRVSPQHDDPPHTHLTPTRLRSTALPNLRWANPICAADAGSSTQQQQRQRFPSVGRLSSNTRCTVAPSLCVGAAAWQSRRVPLSLGHRKEQGTYCWGRLQHAPACTSAVTAVACPRWIAVKSGIFPLRLRRWRSAPASSRSVTTAASESEPHGHGVSSHVGGGEPSAVRSSSLLRHSCAFGVHRVP